MSFALITGASKGIGKSIAIELAKKGYSILLVARSGEALRELADRLKQEYKVDAAFLALDMTAPGAAQQVLDFTKQHGYAVSVLVNNAGYGLSGSFERHRLAEQVNMMQLNMQVPVELCRLFLPDLKQHSRSYIMNIASSAAYQAIPYLTVYAASKAFVVAFSRGLRQELRQTPVSVTCVSPGATDTDFVVRAELGQKGLKTADKVNMTPDAVAAIAVRAMLARKAEVIVGFINKAGAFFSWLLPKSLVEKTTMKIYE